MMIGNPGCIRCQVGRFMVFSRNTHIWGLPLYNMNTLLETITGNPSQGGWDPMKISFGPSKVGYGSSTVPERGYASSLPQIIETKDFFCMIHWPVRCTRTWDAAQKSPGLWYVHKGYSYIFIYTVYIYIFESSCPTITGRGSIPN